MDRAEPAPAPAREAAPAPVAAEPWVDEAAGAEDEVAVEDADTAPWRDSLSTTWMTWRFAADVEVADAPDVTEAPGGGGGGGAGGADPPPAPHESDDEFYEDASQTDSAAPSDVDRDAPVQRLSPPQPRTVRGRGSHSFPFPLNLSLLCPFPLNLNLLCPPYSPN